MSIVVCVIIIINYTSQQYVTTTPQTTSNKNKQFPSQTKQTHVYSIEISHAHYEEQDPDRSFFMVGAFKRSV